MSMIVQVRLPDYEAEFVQQKVQKGKSRSDVLRESVACLMEQELKTLMAEGYAEMASVNATFAQSALPAQRAVVPNE